MTGEVLQQVHHHVCAAFQNLHPAWRMSDAVVSCKLVPYMQVLMAQWMPSKALAEVMTATQYFQQTSQAQAKTDQAGRLVTAQNGLNAQLWLQCRLQVAAMP